MWFNVVKKALENYVRKAGTWAEKAKEHIKSLAQEVGLEEAMMNKIAEVRRTCTTINDITALNH
jgi:DNA-directed RNA polymerase subunit F